jgi:Zn-dependent M28 family amino/carboxypeptidase
MSASAVVFVMRLLLLGLLLVPASGCADDGGATPRVDRPPFPEDQAYSLLLEQVEFGPRVPGQPGHARQIEWMKQYLGERADTVVEQSFSQETTRGETLQLTNILARFHPEQRERVLLITHWDTRPTADMSRSAAERQQPIPGANDGASGTAVLMALAEVFRQQPPPLGVDLLFVDGEDYGPETADMFFGARYFGANQPSGYPPLYGVLIDMIGDSDLRLPREGYSQERAPEVLDRVWRVAREMGYGGVFVDSPGGYVTDDHVALNDAGIRTIDIIDFDYGPGNSYWHTLQDAPEHTSAESLDVVGEVLAELIYRGG